jgi:hypothetical protein
VRRADAARARRRADGRAAGGLAARGRDDLARPKRRAKSGHRRPGQTNERRRRSRRPSGGAAPETAAIRGRRRAWSRAPAPRCCRPATRPDDGRVCEKLRAGVRGRGRTWGPRPRRFPGTGADELDAERWPRRGVRARSNNTRSSTIRRGGRRSRCPAPPCRRG